MKPYGVPRGTRLSDQVMKSFHLPRDFVENTFSTYVDGTVAPFRVLQDPSGRDMQYKILKFPGGELHVRFDKMPEGDQACGTRTCMIIGNICNSEDFMLLMVLTEAIRRTFMDQVQELVDIHLILHYFPYARQDRVAVPGEGLYVKMAANLINAQNYKSVEIWDPHSNVTPALLDRCAVVPPEKLFKWPKSALKNTVLVAPDLGAVKRVSECARAWGLPMIQANKKRDPVTGNLSGAEVYSFPEAFKAHDLLIVDDICDGGRTFIELAKVLRPLTTGKIRLYVTHGIFSAGFPILEEYFDTIYCPNYMTAMPPPDFVKT